MEQQILAVENRQGTGKSVTRKIRQLGKIPGVVYGLGHNASVTVDPKPIHKLLLTEGGKNTIINLQGENLNGKHVIIKDYQIDPLSRQLLHVDLLEIDIKKKIQVTVKLNFIGKAIGVAEGGILNMVGRAIEVKCFPNAIPSHIDVDVSALKIGDSIHINELNFPEGIEKMSQTNQTLVTVVPPAKEEDLAPSLTPAAEPEVITEKKPAEGDAAATTAAAGDKKEDKKK